MTPDPRPAAGMADDLDGDLPEDVAPVARDARLAFAGQWQLAWWKFRASTGWRWPSVVVGIYFVAAFADVLAPYGPGEYSARYTYAPPQTLHLWDTTEAGLEFGLHVHGYKVQVDPRASAGSSSSTPP